jgi:hypothetical protein
VNRSTFEKIIDVPLTAFHFMRTLAARYVYRVQFCIVTRWALPVKVISPGHTNSTNMTSQSHRSTVWDQKTYPTQLSQLSYTHMNSIVYVAQSASTKLIWRESSVVNVRKRKNRCGPVGGFQEAQFQSCTRIVLIERLLRRNSVLIFVLLTTSQEIHYKPSKRRNRSCSERH